MTEVQNENVEVRSLPRIGLPAPQFEAKTTHSVLKLEDYKGKSLILFSHLADFTPVCTTEFIGFQKMYPELREMNTELLGLSIDSVHSHIAWVRNIEEKFGVEIEFPVIADLTMDVAHKFGMIMPDESDTETSRAVFVMDLEQVVRAIIYYPSAIGRNMDEIKRLLIALQTADEHKIATPANWTKGERVIVPPAPTQELAAERMNNPEYECKDFYFCTKEIK